MAAFIQESAYIWKGLSTDTKPTNVELQARCYETDTQTAFLYRIGSHQQWRRYDIINLPHPWRLFSGRVLLEDRLAGAAGSDV